MIDFQILHIDPAFVVCIKPPRVLSTDEPGGMPDLCRQALGEENFRTVHRLDRVVSGLMVLARTKRAASDLSQQIREGIFHKEYTAVLHGSPTAPTGTLVDLLAIYRVGAVAAPFDGTVSSILFEYVGFSREVTIPEGVTRIEPSAFESNEYVQRVTIPESVRRIGECAFDDCDKLTFIYVAGSREKWEKVKLREDAIPESVSVACADD